MQVLSTPLIHRNGGPIDRFGTTRPCGPTGWLALLLIKAGNVETNSGSTTTTTRKQVWIFDICHRQIHVRMQISKNCKRIKPYVHIRCEGIHPAPYIDTWTCYLPKESRLTRHTDITQPSPSQTLVEAPTHSLTIPPQPKHSHASHTPPVPTGLVKPNPNPLIQSPPIPP